MKPTRIPAKIVIKRNRIKKCQIYACYGTQIEKILKGIVRTARIDYYWSTNRVIDTLIFHKTKCRNRF